MHLDPSTLTDEQWVEMRAQAVWIKQHYLLCLAKMFEANEYDES